MSSKYVFICAWVPCNDVIPGVIGHYPFFPEPTGDGVLGFLPCELPDGSALFFAEEKRRAGQGLTEREAERFP